VDERERRYVLLVLSTSFSMTGDVTRGYTGLHTKLEEIIRAFPDQ